MAALVGGTCETNDYLLELKVVALDSDPYDLPKNRRPVDIDMWPGIRFPDIYMYLKASISCCTVNCTTAFFRILDSMFFCVFVALKLIANIANIQSVYSAHPQYSYKI